MSNITVVTSIIGGKDNLIETQNTDGATFKAFIDGKCLSEVWETLPAYDRFISDRRNSRHPKIQIHQYVDTMYSLWIDGNVSLKVPAKQVIDEWLKDADIAVCKHHARDCLYDEAKICADAVLDDPQVIQSQVKKYDAEGFGKHRGLGECTVIARRHTEKVEQFNNYWWSEHCKHSVRDQISFTYALDKAGLKVNYIEPCIYKHPFFEVISHLTARPEPNV